MISQKTKTKLRRLKYRVSHDVLNLNNMVIFVAAIIAISWAWGSINAMQKNYALQQELDTKNRDKLIAEIQTETLKYEQKYYESQEYQELAARDKLGLVAQGEKVLILPANASSKSNNQTDDVKQDAIEQESNFRQWVNFLFGGSASQE